MKKILSTAIKIAFISGAFYYLFTRFDLSMADLFDALGNLGFGHAVFWFSFAAIVKLAGIFCGVFRWHFLLKGQGVRLPFWYLAKCWFMGRAIGLFLPGTVGLDGYRLIESAAYTGEAIKCTTVIAVEKLIGFVALGLLVFLTLPLGARLFDFNIVVLAIVLGILFTFIATAFLLLLNPRIVQVIVASVPVPDSLRNKVNTLGAAVTAYSSHRGTLLLAVLLGLGIHLGICLMYFGVAMAISGGEARIFDILFASPLIIVASIIAPTVSGVGVREGVMAILLGAKYGAAESFLFGHLGLWVGEAIPFLLSLPLLIFATRPNRDEFLAEMAELREAQAESGEGDLHLSPEDVRAYRGRLLSCLSAGILGGLIGGAIVGLAEATWHLSLLQHATDSAAYWWAPLLYGICFAGLGVGVAAALTFAYLLFDKFAAPTITFGLSLGGTLAALILVIGRFRYQRDVLGEHALSMAQNGLFLASALGIGLATALLSAAVLSRFKMKPARAFAAGVAVYLMLVTGGLMIAGTPETTTPNFTPVQAASGPNILLIVVDTLRADHLRAYNSASAAETPNITKFANDSILFQNSFAQSSWTKASFGTIFSGMYPEAHTATGKASALPDEVITIAEVLRDGGYYTRGYSNNPNITSTFNYNQGFVEYTDLKPDLYFGATPSCEKLVLYDILRKVVQKLNGMRGGRIAITDFYQPANVITDTGLAWIDRGERPGDAPFFLFLHYMDPHDPFRDPERPGKGYARVQLGNPDPEKYLEAFQRSYNYEIEYMDTHVGRLLDGLRERDLYEDTLIVFTADHGEEFFEHGGWWHGLSLYDEQIAIPLIVKLPGNSMAGTVNTDLVRHVDIAPTVARVAGQPEPEMWQGQSLLTEDLSLTQTSSGHVYAHLDFEGIVLRALRTQDHKLIQANESNKRNYAPVELYSLTDDPQEQENLAGQAIADDILPSMQKTIDEMRAFILENAAEPSTLNIDELSPEELDQLESLGYVQ